MKEYLFFQARKGDLRSTMQEPKRQSLLHTDGFERNPDVVKKLAEIDSAAATMTGGGFNKRSDIDFRTTVESFRKLFY